jgi:hypothetical protein
MTPEVPTEERLHAQLLGCVERAKRVDIRPFEGRMAREILEGLAPLVRDILVDSIALCREALSRYDAAEIPAHGSVEDALGAAPHSDSGVFYLTVDEMVGRSDVAQAETDQRVADIAFMGVTELRPKLASIERLHERMDGWEVVSECGSGVRRVIKSLTALEGALCERGGIESELSFASEVSRSLEVRRQYARLRQSIAGEQPTPDTLLRALRRVGTSIAILVGRDIYPELRVHDRRQLRELQGRILVWLRGPADTPEAVTDGLRLWQDLVGFAGLLQQVSRRQELVEHDAAVLAEARRALEVSAGPIDDAVLLALRSLRGLDEELDALLVANAEDARSYLAPVARLHEALGPNQHAPVGAEGAMGLREGSW